MILDFLTRVLATFTLVSGVYFWWVGNTHDMAYMLFMTLILENNTKEQRDDG